MSGRDPGEGAIGMLDSIDAVRRLVAESRWLREMLVVCPHETLKMMKQLDAASREELRRQLDVGELLPAPSPVIKRRSRLAIRAYDDGLSDAPFGDSRGAGYGAYLVPPWFRYRESAGDLVIDVVYTLATANPWQVQLLSTPVRVRSVGHHLGSQPWVHHERVSP